MLPEDRSRIAEKIKARIDARKATNPGQGEARTFQVDLDLTRYDKGSAFARAMLIGLGQIHIDGKTHVDLLPAHDAVGESARQGVSPGAPDGSAATADPRGRVC
ncbi:MAG TPA: hypothetical protein VLX90_02205 [Steroidobacteraceae bacterium]|nr:hypothetical protein [Steroidobacteraceae bacterium]